MMLVLIRNTRLAYDTLSEYRKRLAIITTRLQTQKIGYCVRNPSLRTESADWSGLPYTVPLVGTL